MKLRPSILLASISSIVIPATVQAVDFTWNVGTGNWEDAANWINGVPGGGGGNFVHVNNGGTVNINGTTNAIQDPFVGNGVGTSGTVNQLAGNHANSGWSFFGVNGGTGTWNVAATAGNFSTGRLYVGGRRDAANGGTGTFTFNSSGTATMTSDVSIGTRGGNGTLNVGAGTFNANTWFIIGETVNGGGGSTGVVNQTGGTVSNAATDGQGRFWMASKENDPSIASSATYNLSGGVLNARNASIGRHYQGDINQTGGTANFTQANDETTFATEVGSSSTYTLSAGTVNFNGTTQIGTRGTANFNMTGGTVTANGWNGIGRFAGGSGTLTVSGGTYTHTGNTTSIIIGEEGTGTVNILGTGTVLETSTNGLRIAHGTGGNGTINLATGGTLGAVFIQKTNVAGTATINLSGGTVRALGNTANFFVGLTPAELPIGADGITFDTNGNAITITQDLTGTGGFTKAGTGTLNITGAPTYTGTTTVNGGTLSQGNGGLTGTISGAVTVNAGGTFAFNRSDDISDNRTFTGTGAVAQNGPGNLTLTGAYGAFTGSIEANAGKVTATGNFGGNVNVNNGGRLVNSGGAVGTINSAGLTVANGATLDLDFTALGATFDQIVSSGGITFGSAFTLNLFQEGTANPFSDNGTYSIFDYATTVTGSPSGFSVGNPVIGKSYQLADNGGTTTIRLTIADAVLVEWANAGSGLWSLNTNWTPNLVPNVATADVTFGSAIVAATTVDLDGNKTAGKLTFNNANAYTIGGAAGTLTLDNGLAAATITVTAGSHAIDRPMVLANATTIATDTGTALQLGDITGTQALVKAGNGTLTLNGATSTTNTLSINGGIVQAGNGGAAGAIPSGAITIASGARLSFNNTGTATVANAISGAGALSQDAAGTVNFTGTSTLTGATDLNAGTFNNAGSITGTSSVDINNTTDLQAGSTTTTTGAITVGTGGTLASAATASFANRFNVDGGGSATISAGTFVQTAPADNSGAFIGENGVGTLNISGGTTTVHEARVGVNNGSNGTLNLSGGRMDVNHWTSIATNAGSTGNVTQTGGTLNQNHTDWLSVGETGSGTFTMSGNSVLNDQAVVDTSVRGTNKGNIVIGRNSGSTGSWTLIDTATARIRELLVGNAASTTGTVNIAGTSSVTSSYDLHIGNNGTGTVNVAGGSLTTTSGWTQIGMGGTGNGALNVSAGSVYNREMRIGMDGTGVMDISGGTVTANQAISLGLNPTGHGTTTVRGTGTLTIDNGGLSAAGVNPGAAGTGTGILNIADSAVVNISNNGGLRIGTVGTGTYHQSGGTLNTSGTIVVGGVGTGAFTQTGGTANATGNIIFGNTGTILGMGTISGGTLATPAEIWVGQAAGASGQIDISGGSVTAGSWLVVGRQGGTGTVNVSNTGSFMKTGGGNGNHVILGSLAGNGTVNQTGGTFGATAGNGEIRLGESVGGVGNWNIAAGLGTADAVVVGAMGGTGNLNIGGTGTITTGNLRISESGAGTVTQSGGVVTVTGALSGQGGGGAGTYHLNDGRLNVNGTATLNGTFNFNGGILSRSTAGLIDIDGNLTPTAPAATLKLDADKTFDISGALNTTAGMTLDLTNLGIPDGTYTGSAITGGFNLGLVAGAISPAGDAFDIGITALTGFDATLNLAGIGDITALRINEDDAFNPLVDNVYWIDEDSGTVTLQYSVVPEPGTGALLLGGLALLARRRRKK